MNNSDHAKEISFTFCGRNESLSLDKRANLGKNRVSDFPLSTSLRTFRLSWLLSKWALLWIHLLLGSTLTRDLLWTCSIHSKDFQNKQCGQIERSKQSTLNRWKLSVYCLLGLQTLSQLRFTWLRWHESRGRVSCYRFPCPITQGLILFGHALPSTSQACNAFYLPSKEPLFLQVSHFKGPVEGCSNLLRACQREYVLNFRECTFSTANREERQAQQNGGGFCRKSSRLCAANDFKGIQKCVHLLPRNS